MTLPRAPRLLPRCSACTSRLSSSILTQTSSIQWPASPALHTTPNNQTRGAKSKSKSTRGPETMTVRLLKDTPSFGKRGSIVPVSAGQMRNMWFPRRQAAYILRDEMRALRADGVTAARDFEFGVEVKPVDKSGSAGSGAEDAKTKVKTIDPERALEILTERLPPRFDFYRQVNDSGVETTTPQQSEEVEASPAAAAAAATPRAVRAASGGGAADLVAARRAAKLEGEAKAREASRPIFGSVNLSDLVASIRSYLVDDPEAATITVLVDDLKFVNAKDADGKDLPAEVSIDRLKNLGSYTFEMRVKGTTSEKKLTRTVRVLPLSS